jgi:hypothetical protein
MSQCVTEKPELRWKAVTGCMIGQHFLSCPTDGKKHSAKSRWTGCVVRSETLVSEAAEEAHRVLCPHTVGAGSCSFCLLECFCDTIHGGDSDSHCRRQLLILPVRMGCPWMQRWVALTTAMLMRALTQPQTLEQGFCLPFLRTFSSAMSWLLHQGDHPWMP